MKILQIGFAFVCLAFLIGAVQHDRGWHGIVPLHSTRTDVERLLGVPEKSGQVSVYNIGGDQVYVEYAMSPCKGSLLGWNVSPDTVLQLNVILQKKTQFAEIKIDERKYVRSYGHVMNLEYINLEEGIKYTVLPDGTILSVSYLPSTRDNHLRCGGFPPFDGGITQYRTYDTYGDLSFTKEEMRLDGLAAVMQAESNMKGYIIVYAGRQSCINEAQQRAQRAREYLINKRGVDARRLIAIDGGYREELETTLYLIPDDVPAPNPTPSLSSSEIKVISNIKGNKCL